MPNANPQRGDIHVITENNQYAGIQANTTILPAILGKYYVIHGLGINTNSTTDVDIVCGAVQVAYVNTPADARTSTTGMANMHLHTPENTAIEISCGAGTFVSITYHLSN